MDNLPEGKTWSVVSDWFHNYIVVGHPDYHGDPAFDCAREAAAGNPEAVEAVLLCTEDLELQKYLQELADG